MKPTKQQELIFNYDGNAVIIAAPGSGKTFVISEKIKAILNNLKNYQGVIAISYTNKASAELKERCLRHNQNPRNSFFGTIDKFFISEIIIPFGKQLFGVPKEPIQTIKLSELSIDLQGELKDFDRDLTLEEFELDYLQPLIYNFLNGRLIIESIGIFANYIFSSSLACRKYFVAKYKYIFIDEYQDAGINQHDILLKITSLGIIGIVVGDLNQSIYAFSGKDSRFLNELTTKNGFKSFSLDKNHRCHASIINYSNRLINKSVELIQCDKTNIGSFRINGDERGIAKWIDKKIDELKKTLEISDNNKIAILTKSVRTGNIIGASLSTPNKIFLSNDLDQSLNVWAGLFSSLLHFVVGKSIKFVEVIEQFVDFDKINRRKLRKLLVIRNELEDHFANEKLGSDEAVDCFIAVAKIIAPNSESREAVDSLKAVVKDSNLLSSYSPVNSNQLNIMTLHKSKGLEFELVFHVDLYEWILPLKGPGFNNDWSKPIYSNWIQDLNLHYVGITRAKKACLLISSTLRTNDRGEVKQGNESDFLRIENLKELRHCN